jgi:hypothetical protein
VFLAFGVVFIIYGWRIYKALVVINLAAIGLGVGVFLGQKLGSGLWGGLMGATVLGIASFACMRYSIALLGGLAGALFGAALWRIATLPDPLIWAGGLAGLVTGALLSFSSGKASIMLFSCTQGSALAVVGALALLHDYPQLTETLTDAIYAHMFLLPVLLLAPTVTGIYMQRKLWQADSGWAAPE